MIANFSSLGLIAAIGIIFLLCFIVVRFFRTIFSLSFIGLVLALISYFVYDYIFATVPVIAALGFVCSIVGITNSNILGKIFAVFGILISAYIILANYGIIQLI